MSEVLALESVRAMRRELADGRAKSRYPKLLQWQVHLYDYVLARDNPGKAAKDLIDATMEGRVSAVNHSHFRARLARGAAAVGFTEPMPEAGT